MTSFKGCHPYSIVPSLSRHEQRLGWAIPQSCVSLSLGTMNQSPNLLKQRKRCDDCNVAGRQEPRFQVWREMNRSVEGRLFGVSVVDQPLSSGIGQVKCASYMRSIIGQRSRSNFDPVYELGLNLR